MDANQFFSRQLQGLRVQRLQPVERHKIARGEIPVIGTRRTTRVLMPDALHALARTTSVTPADPIAEEAIAFVRNRTRLRSVVGGSSLDGVVRPGQTRDTVQDEAESAAPKREKR